MLQNIWQCTWQHLQQRILQLKRSTGLRFWETLVWPGAPSLNSSIQWWECILEWNSKILNVLPKRTPHANTFSPLWHRGCTCPRNWVRGMDKDINAHRPFLSLNFSPLHALLKIFSYISIISLLSTELLRTSSRRASLKFCLKCSSRLFTIKQLKEGKRREDRKRRTGT